MNRFILLYLTCTLLLSNYAHSESPNGTKLYEVINPSRMPSNGQLPIIIKMLDTQGLSDRRIEADSVGINNPSEIQEQSISVKRGTGTLLTTPTTNQSFDLNLTIHGETSTHYIEVAPAYPTIIYQGILPQSDSIWDASVDRKIIKDLIIPEGFTLFIKAGTQILLGSNVNIIVYGRLQVEGTTESPVVFSSQLSSLPWGGIIIENGQSSFSQCFFLNGGADSTRKFGHSNSQAIIQINRSAGTFINCWFIKNIGKVFGVADGVINGDSLIIAYCDTGGEFGGSLVNIKNSVIQNIPDDDGKADDDDNDGFYFSGHMKDETRFSSLENCIISTTEDDCVDHNGSHLFITNCLLEGAIHEGVAASNKDTVVIFNSVIMNCEQGIEAGYGQPTVIADHCLLTKNGVGIRFGDAYDWGCTGLIHTYNTVLYNNSKNIWNYDLKTNAPVEDAISIIYSMTNDVNYDNSIGCINGVPLYSDDFVLLPSSPGYHAGAAGSHQGIIDSPDTIYRRVIITEIFVDTLSNTSSRTWIELHNRSPFAVDVSEWTINSNIGSFSIPSIAPLLPFGFLILTCDTTTFNSNYTTEPVVGNISPLSDNADTLLLINQYGTLIDSIYYFSQLPWPPITRTDRSLVLKDPWLDNASGSNWQLSDFLGGSPGYHHPSNTTSYNELSPSIKISPSLSIIPNPFPSECQIYYSVPYPGFVDITVYSSLGTPLQTLLQQPMQPGKFTIEFDARTLPIGTIYVIQRIDGKILTTATGVLIDHN